MSLIKWEGLGYQATHPAGPHHFPISTLTQMTHRILMGGEKQVLSDLMEYTCYEDVKYYLLQSIQYVFYIIIYNYYNNYYIIIVYNYYNIIIIIQLYTCIIYMIMT